MTSTLHMVENSSIPDQQTARTVLRKLADLLPAPDETTDPDFDTDQLANWLIENELGSLAHATFQGLHPELAERLQPELYTVAAQNALHRRNMQEIDAQLVQNGIPAVLLKGAALAETLYENPEQRSMSDVDLWIRDQDIVQTCREMVKQGYTNAQKVDRPLALEALSEAEIQYYSDDQPPTLVELHLSPFRGWWLQRTAAIDKQAVWSRKEKVAGWASYYQLASEDALLHTAVHLAVNHQFGMAPLRSLIDIALIAQKREVNWQIVVDRAREWRVATAVWFVLDCVQTLIGIPGLENALIQLRPAARRRRQLRRFVTPESVLAGKDMRGEQQRYLFLLLLVDRPQDAAKLAARTLWPEPEWLDARYGGDVDHWQHLRRLVSQREI